MVDSAPNFPGSIVRRQRIMGLGFGLLILVFGIIIGAGGTFLRYKDQLMRPVGFPDPRQIVKDMKGKYGLSEQQEKQIHALFEEQAKDMRDIFKNIGEKQKEGWNKIVAGLKNILDEKQFAAWQKDTDERRQRWEREQRERASHGQQGPGRGGPDSQRGQGGPDRPDGRRDKSGQSDRMQQGPPPGEPMPGGPMPGGPPPGGPMPPPGAPTPDHAPKPTEPAAPPAGSTNPSENSRGAQTSVTITQKARQLAGPSHFYCHPRNRGNPLCFIILSFDFLFCLEFRI